MLEIERKTRVLEGVDPQRIPYAELLKVAGVDTIKELKYRNPAKLAQAMAEANAKRKLVQLLPSEKRIAHWIDAARKLSPKISY